MNISIVIPVYNEADGLSACLDAIAAQKSRPYEVIVVDNNSSDGTTSIAKSYDFITVINEPKQGVVHARTTGFDLTNGDIIARIDGDTILPNDWTSQVESIFRDPSIDAVSGLAGYYGVAADKLVNASDLFFRRRLSKQLENRVFLWGANMAMRRQAWSAVKPYLCQKGDQHEDFDIAIHLQELGYNVSFDERLKAQVSSRRIDTDFMSFMHYVLVSPYTYAQHDIQVKRFMYPVVLVCALGYMPGYILHKGYDPDLGRFSFNKFLFVKSGIGRVDPTTNVL
jgi:glycosyltransferase involved in cell wall biosynthesis